MVKPYQFTCAVRIEELSDELMPIYDLVTPIVKCDTPTEAMRHPDVVAFCEENKCLIYERVRE